MINNLNLNKISIGLSSCTIEDESIINILESLKNKKLDNLFFGISRISTL